MKIYDLKLKKDFNEIKSLLNLDETSKEELRESILSNLSDTKASSTDYVNYAQYLLNRVYKRCSYNKVRSCAILCAKWHKLDFDEIRGNCNYYSIVFRKEIIVNNAFVNVVIKETYLNTYVYIEY